MQAAKRGVAPHALVSRERHDFVVKLGGVFTNVRIKHAGLFRHSPGRGQDSNGAYQSDGPQTCDEPNGGASTKLVQRVRRFMKTRHQHISAGISHGRTPGRRVGAAV